MVLLLFGITCLAKLDTFSQPTDAFKTAVKINPFKTYYCC